MSFYSGDNEFLKQIIPVFNVGDPAGGDTAIVTAQNQINATNTMVDTGNYNVLTNTITTFNTGTVAFNSPVQFNNGITGAVTADGAITTTGDITCRTLFQTSDKRLKTNITPIYQPLQTLQGIRGVYFNWKQNGEEDIGFLAQEVDKVLPIAVAKPTSVEAETDTTDDYWRVSYIKVVPVLVEAVKKLEDRICELEGQMDVVYRYNRLSKG
jgi:hypothetical protein